MIHDDSKALKGAEEMMVHGSSTVGLASYMQSLISKGNLPMDSVSAMLTAGLHARMEGLDLIENNLANANAAGYKADREQFSTYLSAEAATAIEQAGNGARREMPVVENRFADFSQGALQQTGNPADLALEGEGFFVVETAAGPRYTRAGNFHLAADGELRTREGYRVAVRDTIHGQRLAADPHAAFHVEVDGGIVQNGQRIGVVERVQFSRPELLRKEGRIHFSAPAGLIPEPSAAKVRGGQLEASNVDMARDSMRLIESTRHFQMLNRALGLYATMGRNLVEQVAKW